MSCKKSGGSSNSNSFVLNPEYSQSGFGLAKTVSSRPMEELPRDCFYNLCTLEKACGGCVKCGKYKDRNHTVMCSIFCGMVTCFMIAIIFPLVIYSIVDSGINEQVVIDSTSAPNYKSWQNNVVEPGKTVINFS